MKNCCENYGEFESLIAIRTALELNYFVTNNDIWTTLTTKYIRGTVFEVYTALFFEC